MSRSRESTPPRSALVPLRSDSNVPPAHLPRPSALARPVGIRIEGPSAVFFVQLSGVGESPRKRAAYSPPPSGTVKLFQPRVPDMPMLVLPRPTLPPAAIRPAPAAIRPPPAAIRPAPADTPGDAMSDDFESPPGSPSGGCTSPVGRSHTLADPISSPSP